MSQVKTTRIEKKYKDKKTGEYKSITIDYAKVADRLAEFRSSNPNSKIDTRYTIQEDGSVIFRTSIWRNKSDFLDLLKTSSNEVALLSSDSTGSARSKGGGEKDFEKLETISVGRALALLGYAVTGDIASSEEMEEFERFKEQKRQEALKEAEAKLTKAKSLGELKAAFMSLSGAEKAELTELKDELKAKLEAQDADN